MQLATRLHVCVTAELFICIINFIAGTICSESHIFLHFLWAGSTLWPGLGPGLWPSLLLYSGKMYGTDHFCDHEKLSRKFEKLISIFT